MSNIAETVLKSLVTVSEVINELREDQLKELIMWEIANKKRKDIVIRLRQRYSKLVSARERKEILFKLSGSVQL